MADRYELAFVKNALSATGTNPQEQGSLEAELFKRLLAAGLTVSAAGVISTTVPINPGTSGALNPLDYGAVGDGVTLDTVALQATINATAATGGAVCLPATGTFLCGNLTVTNRTNFTLRSLGATIQWTGTAAGSDYIGIQLLGTLTNCTFEDLILVGDGVLGNRHAGIWNLNGVTFTNIAMRRNRVSSVVFGLGLAADGSGTIQGLEISGNYLDTIVGTVSGVGYGIYHASSSATAAHVRIINNEISRAQRHAIYQGKGAGVVIANNTIRLHRTGQGVPGSPLPALVVSRSEDVVVSGNLIDTAQDGGISVDSGASNAGRNVAIVGNTISNGSGVATGIILGSSDPLTNGNTTDITVSGNTIYTTGVNNPQIYIYEGTRLNLVGNSCYMVACPGTASSLYLAGSLETTGTATYTNDVMVKANLFHGTNSGGSYTPIELGALLADSGARVDFVSNRCVMPGNAFALDGAQTDVNIHAVDMPTSGLTLVAMATTISGLKLGTTSTDGELIQNTTAATGGVTVQISPRTRWLGTAWDTAASQTVAFFAEALPATAATPTGTWKIGYSLNGAAATYPLTLSSAGLLTVLKGLTAGDTINVTAATGGLVVLNNSAADAGVTGASYLTFQTAGSNRWYVGMSAAAGTGNFDFYDNIDGYNAGSFTKGTGVFNALKGATVPQAAGLSFTGTNNLLLAATNPSSALTLTIPAIRQAETVAIRPQTYTTLSTPLNPTGTSNTSGLMMGLAGAITPQVTGKIRVTICGQMSNTATNGAKVQIRVGTGTAPVNGGALAGTVYGSQQSITAIVGALSVPFCLSALVTGLTLGTACWLDVDVAAIVGGTATIASVAIDAFEV